MRVNAPVKTLSLIVHCSNLHPSLNANRVPSFGKALQLMKTLHAKQHVKSFLKSIKCLFISSLCGK